MVVKVDGDPLLLDLPHHVRWRLYTQAVTIITVQTLEINTDPNRLLCSAPRMKFSGTAWSYQWIVIIQAHDVSKLSLLLFTWESQSVSLDLSLLESTVSSSNPLHVPHT